jgi:hypothetical protein
VLLVGRVYGKRVINLEAPEVLSKPTFFIDKIEFELSLLLHLVVLLVIFAEDVGVEVSEPYTMPTSSLQPIGAG